MNDQGGASLEMWYALAEEGIKWEQPDDPWRANWNPPHHLKG